MSLPIRTTIDDIKTLCTYLSKKPTGATTKEAKSVLEAKYLDGRKINANKYWNLIDDKNDKLKITEKGRELIKGEAASIEVFKEIIKTVAPYNAIIERVAHRTESSISAVDVAAHWHEHFPTEASGSDRVLNDQAVCFFQIVEGAKLGKITVGRKEQPTRLEFDEDSIQQFIDSEIDLNLTGADTSANPEVENNNDKSVQTNKVLGQGIFIAHGKNKKPLEQLKKILDQFKVPYKVAVEEPNLGRPIGTKVREVMESCNCAILIFTADEEFKNKDGSTIWRPSENVIYELGASGYLYDKRIVIMKEEEVEFPTNFRDLGYISFQKDLLEAKAMDVIKELIGFEIVKVST